MKYRKGLTLIELMIAMALFSMVFLLVSSLLMTVINTNNRSQSKESFEQVKNDLHAELANRIRWGEVIKVESGNLVVDTETYSFSGGKILRNGQPVTPDDVVVTSFDVRNLTTDTQYASIEVAIGLKNGATGVQQDSMRLVVSQRKTTLDQTE